MTTNFPATSIDTFTAHVLGDTISETYDNNQQDAIVALETKVGIDSSAVTSTLDYKLKNTSSVNPGHKHTISATAFTDVDMTGLADGNLMQYSTAAGNKWIPATTSAPDASTTVKGVTKMSVAPASPTSPIAVGDNDGRVPTQGENDSLVGNNTDIAVGTGNKFVTQTGLQHNAEKYAADAGANDTYVITLSPVPTSYTNGMVVHFKANTINTGAATLNVNSLGAKTIVKGVSTTLANNDILAGQFVTVIYDGTNFVLQNPVGVNNLAPALGTWASATQGADTQAATDGFIVGYATIPQGNTNTTTIKTDSASTPTVVRVQLGDSSSPAPAHTFPIMTPVKKNDYYNITVGASHSVTAYFIPLGV